MFVDRRHAFRGRLGVVPVASICFLGLLMPDYLNTLLTDLTSGLAKDTLVSSAGVPQEDIDHKSCNTAAARDPLALVAYAFLIQASVAGLCVLSLCRFLFC